MTTTDPNQRSTDTDQRPNNRTTTEDPRIEFDAPLVPLVAAPASLEDGLESLQRDLREARAALERVESVLSGDGGRR